ncbi:hypothetical protein CLAFUW4_12613 [Fulvia fulva]|uniref:Uncharacterized protein n=1 Tax=Passalora fulva TaxID=5499 RepID=A0A9Q8USW2_PASFU|nr:uncharacterized protein CLAFUR5_11637 [Fulvia fulva]KAK4617899.1 hypothetical protein CLAFUR4_12618 [Fulvia fulva]KAK4619043.1 hypothetical protein CLAFUR0_12629 [Fulvia fulva]UJO21160.1 hypothetical protein CLAFUR5_11637 [Fulvia fulva]WPV17950.1 hypothetical protein CLAFUW4_12613 [Fulvia fulva]WPV33403.1 hypothetical protein CLAFUW7_12620 [Fulvia fulva]
MSPPTSTSPSTPPDDNPHPTSDDTDNDNTGKQQCPICLDHKLPNQFTKFTTCPTKPCNTTCKFCWTKHVCAHSQRGTEDERVGQEKKGNRRGEEEDGSPRSSTKRKASSVREGDASPSSAKKRKATISKAKVVDSEAEDEDQVDPQQKVGDVADPKQSAPAQSGATSIPKPSKLPRKRGKKAAGEATGPQPMSPETKAKREKQAIRREKRKGLEQKKRQVENPSAEMLAAWEAQFGSAAT